MEEWRNGGKEERKGKEKDWEGKEKEKVTEKRRKRREFPFPLLFLIFLARATNCLISSGEMGGGGERGGEYGTLYIPGLSS